MVQKVRPMYHGTKKYDQALVYNGSCYPFCPILSQKQKTIQFFRAILDGFFVIKNYFFLFSKIFYQVCSRGLAGLWWSRGPLGPLNFFRFFLDFLGYFRQIFCHKKNIFFLFSKKKFFKVCSRGLAGLWWSKGLLRPFNFFPDFFRIFSAILELFQTDFLS